MKRFLLFVFAIVAFAACEQAPIEEQSAIRQDAPETLTVGFEGDDTRIQLNEAQKTVWNSGDEVSVFYRTNGNQKWQYTGEDGVREANLSCVQDATGDTAITKTIVVYPYNETYWLNTDSYCIEATTPATQYYAIDSYGVGDNLMVSQGEFTQLSLKNVYGWLKLQLTGDGETIKSIKFRGNDGEQVAGLIHVDTATAEATLAAEMGDADDNNAGSNLVFEDTILTEVTLDCGEGVALGKEATAFYIALPPQTFDDGFTVEVACVDGSKMVKSSNKALSIERNHIQPMAEFSYTANISPSNQIWYTSSNGKVVTPNKTNVFGANIISNNYNNGMGVITFDGDVTTIGDNAFYSSCRSLTSVNIPDSVTTIGNNAFWLCTSLTSVTIGNNVTTIGEGAFFDCTSLTSVNIPDSVTSIGERAFANCTSLTEFKGKLATEDGRSLIVDNTIIAYINASGNTYNIPDSVTTIGACAFYFCDSLTSVTIPDSVTTIGSSAFAFCKSLTSVYCKATTPPALSGAWVFDDNGSGREIYVPYKSISAYKSNEYWGKYASDIVSYNFETDEVAEMPANEIWYTSSNGKVVTPYKTNVFGATIISNKYNNGKGVITFDGKVTMIGYEAFWNRTSLTSVTIPNSVTTIGDDAFKWCESLTSVTIGDGVTSIGNSAFYECNSLTSVTIGDSVTSIGNSAFYDCDRLTSVTIGDRVTTIGEYAFYYGDSLTSVTIGDSVTTIGEYAFYYCDSLKSVYFKATTPPALGGYYIFDNNGSGRKMYVPAGSVNAYKSALRWGEYASAIVGYDFENGVVVE